MEENLFCSTQSKETDGFGSIPAPCLGVNSGESCAVGPEQCMISLYVELLVMLWLGSDRRLILLWQIRLSPVWLCSWVGYYFIWSGPEGSCGDLSMEPSTAILTSEFWVIGNLVGPAFFWCLSFLSLSSARSWLAIIRRKGETASCGRDAKRRWSPYQRHLGNGFNSISLCR